MPENHNNDDAQKLSWQEKAMVFKDWLMTKSGKITAGSTISLLLLTLLIVKACEPAKAGVLYAVCSAFSEQNVTFPETIDYNLVEEYSSSVRIYYAHTDAFGQYITEFIECSFAQNEEKGLFLKAAIYDTVKEITEKTPLKNKGRLYKVQQKYVDLFNQSQSAQIIMQMDEEQLDLTLPRPPTNFAF